MTTPLPAAVLAAVPVTWTAAAIDAADAARVADLAAVQSKLQRVWNRIENEERKMQFNDNNNYSNHESKIIDALWGDYAKLEAAEALLLRPGRLRRHVIDT